MSRPISPVEPAAGVSSSVSTMKAASTTAEHARRLVSDSELAKRLVAALGFKADS